MKPFILAIAALGLAGTIGTANADQLTSTSVEIWNAATGEGVSTGVGQQGLPNATAAFSAGPLGLVASTDSPYTQPINYHDTTDDTIGGFFTTAGNPVPTTCGAGASCQGITLSSATFNQATVMEFTFTVPTAGTLLISHDDGVSVYVAGTEDTGNITNDLYNLQYSAGVATDVAMPQTMAENLADTLSLMPGTTYDLWYNEANGLPATLETTFTASVPAPIIGHGLLVTLAIGGVLFGSKLLERSKKRSPLETVSRAAI